MGRAGGEIEGYSGFGMIADTWWMDEGECIIEREAKNQQNRLGRGWLG